MNNFNNESQRTNYIPQDNSVQNLFYLIESKVDSKQLQTNKLDDLVIQNQILHSQQSYIFGKRFQFFQNKEKQRPLKINNFNNIFQLTLCICRFINLTSLDLYDLEINSIQPVTFLNAPNLNFLFIEKNHLTTMKPLNKLNQQNLKVIRFENNPIKYFSLQRLKMRHTFNALHQQDQVIQKVMMEDLCRLVKIQAKFIMFMNIKGNQRIKQNKIISMFKQRFVMQENGLFSSVLISLNPYWDVKI